MRWPTEINIGFNAPRVGLIAWKEKPYTLEFRQTWNNALDEFNPNREPDEKREECSTQKNTTMSP